MKKKKGVFIGSEFCSFTEFTIEDNELAIHRKSRFIDFLMFWKKDNTDRVMWRNMKDEFADSFTRKIVDPFTNKETGGIAYFVRHDLATHDKTTEFSNADLVTKNSILTERINQLHAMFQSFMHEIEGVTDKNVLASRMSKLKSDMDALNSIPMMNMGKKK